MSSTNGVQTLSLRLYPLSVYSRNTPILYTQNITKDFNEPQRQYMLHPCAEFLSLNNVYMISTRFSIPQRPKQSVYCHCNPIDAHSSIGTESEKEYFISRRLLNASLLETQELHRIYWLRTMPRRYGLASGRIFLFSKPRKVITLTRSRLLFLFLNSSYLSDQTP